MKLQLDTKEVIALTRVIFNEIETMRQLDATSSDEHGVALSVLKLLLNSTEITIDDNLPF